MFAHDASSAREIVDGNGNIKGKCVKNGKSRYYFLIPNFAINIYRNGKFEYSTRNGQGNQIRSLDGVKLGDQIKFVRSGFLNAPLETIAEITLYEDAIEYAYDVIKLDGSIEKDCFWEKDCCWEEDCLCE